MTQECTRKGNSILTRTKNQRKTAILVTDKMDFKTKLVKKNKKQYFIYIKGEMHKCDGIILNIEALNTGAPNYIQEILL